MDPLRRRARTERAENAGAAHIARMVALAVLTFAVGAIDLFSVPWPFKAVSFVCFAAAGWIGSYALRR
ncbi:MAG TPA: hypothetical protein VFB22_01210 [Candidatus Baltobacteraceae bacterium]|nr:hypothetical protein [Candidatus Baltobacteraceae bacterium]